MPEHCWHFTGVVLSSHPGQYEQVCCHCGQTRYEIPERLSHHGCGPWATRGKDIFKYRYRGGEGPCEPKEKAKEADDGA